jgi:hypothetical protein
MPAELNHQPLPSSDGAWNPIARKTENTGAVFCPPRLSHIAKMRCGEYQERFGCQRRCRNAVAPGEIKALGALVEERVSLGRDRGKGGGGCVYFDTCAVCDEPKAHNRSRRCHRCQYKPQVSPGARKISPAKAQRAPR